MLSNKCKHRAKEGESRGKQVLRGLTAKQGFGRLTVLERQKTEVQSPFRGRELVGSSGSWLRVWKNNSPGIRANNE